MAKPFFQGGFQVKELSGKSSLLRHPFLKKLSCPAGTTELESPGAAGGFHSRRAGGRIIGEFLKWSPRGNSLQEVATREPFI
jgi:hypothetical protein